MEPPWRRQVDRFCHQYLQLEANLDFPQDEYIRLDDVQDDVYKRVFSHDASNFGPPDRYRARILKELVSRIESAIDDWDKYVSSSLALLRLPFIFLFHFMHIPVSRVHGPSDQLVGRIR